MTQIAKTLVAMRPQPGGAPALFSAKVDRADEPSEDCLLEALSDFQITIPKLVVIPPSSS